MFVGCLKTEAMMKSWVGKDDTQLVNTWGAPDKESVTRSGGKVYTYKFIEYNGWSGVNMHFTRSFTVDGEGIVTNYMWRGSKNESQFYLAK